MHPELRLNCPFAHAEEEEAKRPIEELDFVSDILEALFLIAFEDEEEYQVEAVLLHTEQMDFLPSSSFSSGKIKIGRNGRTDSYGAFDDASTAIR
jgi:hypothetical protein